MYRSLKKEDHYALIAQAFAAVGIEADCFDIRMKGKKSDTVKSGVDEIKETFGGVPVEVK